MSPYRTTISSLVFLSRVVSLVPSEIIAVECFRWFRAWILGMVQVWEGSLEAAGAVASRFEDVFLSGSLWCSTSDLDQLQFLGPCSFCCLASS
ncbi:hypothetical protein DY000_02010423 [Brassica cretica]|uniref:Secreted protein n=1 Tax=Brassica cretica TaxID=69181 RepID=A0ABQ7C9F8_BRACR|nr:hypothetical protein DY000_02010423 [Brassica cretica]